MSRARTVVVATTVPVSLTTFYGPTTVELAARGWRVVTVSSGPLGPARSALHSDRHVVVPMRRDVSPAADAAALARWVWLLARLRPRAVLAGTPKASLVALVAARITGVPVRGYHLLGLRLEGATGPSRWVLTAVEHLTARCATRILAVSPSLAEAFRRRGLAGSRTVLVPGPGSTHGVDATYFDPTNATPADLRATGAQVGRATITFVGRLHRDKGLDALRDAAASIAARAVPCQLLVVGPVDDDASTGAVDALRHLDLPVVVVGHQDDVRPWLAASDVLVLPTLREGMPNVVLEAAAMGVPAVTTRATGARDAVVDGRTGLLIDVDAPDQLADALARLVADPGLRRRLGDAARRRVLTDYRPDVVARAVVDALLG